MKTIEPGNGQSEGDKLDEELDEALEEYEELEKQIADHHEKTASVATGEVPPWPTEIDGLPVWPDPSELPPGVRESEMVCQNDACPYLLERGESWHGQPFFLLQRKNTNEGAVEPRPYFLRRCPHCIYKELAD